MTPQEAQKRIKKLLGPRALWRDSGRRTSPEAREAAHQEQTAANERKKAAETAMNARLAELMKDPEYQRLLADYRVAREAQRMAGRGGGYRIAAGINLGFAFEVRAQGDNWAEVVRALEQREPNQMTVAKVS